MKEARWSWNLVERLNHSSNLDQTIRELVNGLYNQYAPVMLGIWLWREDEIWRELAWQGLRNLEMEQAINGCLLTWTNGPDRKSSKYFVTEAGLFYVLPLLTCSNISLLGLCIVAFEEKKAPETKRPALVRWVRRFSSFLSLHIEHEQAHQQFFKQQVALNLLLSGSNILNRATSEKQLFTEASEMAMGILNVDKGIFVYSDALDPDKMWITGFGRLKDIDYAINRTDMTKYGDRRCADDVFCVKDVCYDCPYFTTLCRQCLGDPNPDMFSSRYPLVIRGESVGELRLLHESHELALLDRGILNTFVMQISQALETMRHRSLLEKLATHDPLTGLLNRSGLEERLEAECARAGRLHEELLFVLLDLDHFKQVNDQLGHPVGDQLLIRLGQVLMQSVRSYDLVARLGGDEFVVVFGHWEESEANFIRVGDWLKEVEKHLPAIGIDIGISGGVARFPEATDFRSLYQRADEALYRAKQQGRHRICGLDS